MGQTTQQIENHIEKTRDDLGANLHELEYKVKEITDWRHHFNKRPMTLMGVAFGGGILLAALSGRGRPAADGVISLAPLRQVRPKSVETWEHIKDALMGVAATRITDFVGELVPGFADEYRNIVRPPLR